MQGATNDQTEEPSQMQTLKGAGLAKTETLKAHNA